MLVLPLFLNALPYFGVLAIYVYASLYMGMPLWLLLVTMFLAIGVVVFIEMTASYEYEKKHKKWH